MKHRIELNLPAIHALLTAGFVLIAAPIAALEATFTYQGELTADGVVIDGAVDLNFSLFDAETGGTLLDDATLPNVTVSGGRLTVDLSFDRVYFDGSERWLEIAVSNPAGSGNFEILTPRQRIRPAPYALFADQSATVVDNGGPDLDPTTFWSLTGNAAAAGDFIGTTNGEPFVVRVNSQRVFEVSDAVDGSGAHAPNWLAGSTSNSVGAAVSGATVGGGSGNTASGSDATVGGGSGNVAAGLSATVAGGGGNLASSNSTTVAGGAGNDATGGSATIGGGAGNNASGGSATIGGGAGNQASGSTSTIGGGASNVSAGINATVGGGRNNQASEDDATVAGGQNNAASGAHSSVGGGTDNESAGLYGVVGGGSDNRASGGYAVVGGGILNMASAANATVAGGVNNTAGDLRASIGGGTGNEASAEASTISGGAGNAAAGTYSVIAGGELNRAEGTRSVVGGGRENVASTAYAMVPGGLSNRAGGQFSFAAGRRAKVRTPAQAGNAEGDAGTFVWADSTEADFESTGSDQFLVRAAGGAAIGVNDPAGFQLRVVGPAWIDHPTNGGNDLVVGGTTNAATGDDGRIVSNPALPSSDLHLISNDNINLILNDDGSVEGSVFDVRNTAGTVVFEANANGDATVQDDLDVGGTLSKGGGSFKIDHPLAPTEKYLYHSFVESPDMMNVYNGNVVLDANGEAWVEMPEWFEALNRDFRYQLTPIGAPAPGLYVARKIADNRFRIAGGSPGLEVSWLVTGIRQDPYAEANRIPVEVDKPEAERGSLLHPAAWRQSTLQRN